MSIQYLLWFMYTICTHSHKNRRVVSILSTTAVLAVLSDVKIVLEQVKQVQATDTSLSSGVIHHSHKSPSNYRCNADSPKVLRLDWNVYFGQRIDISSLPCNGRPLSWQGYVPDCLCCRYCQYGSVILPNAEWYIIWAGRCLLCFEQSLGNLAQCELWCRNVFRDVHGYGSDIIFIVT